MTDVETGATGAQAPREIQSVEELIEILSTVSSDGAERWYRGHRREDWQLSPSTFRTDGHRDNEEQMLARFRHEAAATGRQYGFDDWGWIAFAQHHELPTRLLDWSQSPLVGLYFASEEPDAEHRDEDSRNGSLFILKPAQLNRDAGDADGNLRLLSTADDDLKNYLPGKDGGYQKTPRAVVAPLLFDRIRFQAGTFTVEHRPRPANPEPLRDSGAVQEIRIPGTAKLGIRSQLRALGFDASTIYRDLDRISQRIKKTYGSAS